jgi:aspartyl/asparaginyl beta-hydroxylase (cupin superfamily)
METTRISVTQSPNRDALLAQADAAAAERRFADALALLHAVRDGGSDDLQVALRRASLHRALQEPQAALRSVDEALAFEPLDFMALLLRGTLLDQLGSPEAGEAYGRALAQRPSGDLPPSLQRATDQAQVAYDAHVQELSGRLDSASTAGDDLKPVEQGRVARFATNVARKTRHFHAEPTNFHFPGLAEVEFPDRSLFPWIEALEAATPAIAAELAAVMAAERAELVPYVQYGATVPMRQWKELNHSLDWTAIHLLLRGERVEANARHCPQTMALIATLPQPQLPGYAPNAMFSLLAPHTHIPPHHGVANFRLVCHLPLVLPGKCWFRCGEERREWRMGEAFVFDDTIEHEAANESDQLRVVLIVDIWNPAISEAETAAIARILAAADSAPIGQL